MRAYQSVLVLLMSAGSCNMAGPEPIAVSQRNDLGVTSITIDRSEGASGNVFELRGLTAENDEVASVTLRIGTIADLPELLPGTNTFGSEITLASGAEQRRIVSRETQLFHISTLAVPEPTIRAFLEVSDVASALEREANIVVSNPSATSEVTYYYEACTASNLLSSPVADQCCQFGLADSYYTLFIRPSDYSIIERVHNPEANGSAADCKASNGTGSCNGAACDYGPDGFARANVSTGNSSTAVYTINDAGCSTSQTMSKGEYPNVTGTFPRNQGCPGASEGYSEWDY
jgi:hypothetical protein